MAQVSDCYSRDADFMKVFILRCHSSGVYESNDRVTNQKHGLRNRNLNFGQHFERGAFGVLILFGCFFQITVLRKQFVSSFSIWIYRRSQFCWHQDCPALVLVRCQFRVVGVSMLFISQGQEGVGCRHGNVDMGVVSDVRR